MTLNRLAAVSLLFLSLIISTAPAAKPGGLAVFVCPDELPIKECERYVVHVLMTDAKEAKAARDRLREKGMYGQVTVSIFDGKTLPYIDGMVNRLEKGEKCEVPDSEIKRVLIPETRPENTD